MIQTSDGNFTDMQANDFDADVVTAGTMDLRFKNCSTVEVSFNLLEPTSGEEMSQYLMLTKSVGIPTHLCEAPNLPIT